MLRDHDAVYAGALGRAQEDAEVLRILHRVDHQYQRRIAAGIEVQEQLVQFDAGFPLDDRDHALVVLDR